MYQSYNTQKASLTTQPQVAAWVDALLVAMILRQTLGLNGEKLSCAHA